MIDINELRFDKNGLIPAIVTDARTKAVLMLAYMNKESLKISIDEGRTCFWSRSRGEIWRKGETSGSVQQIVSIKTDCDLDTLLVYVNTEGPSCHTGADTCFFEDVYPDTPETPETPAQGEKAGPFSLGTLHSIIEDRRKNKKPGSYTTYLFEKGIDKILKKLGEESTEVIIAGKSGDKKDTIYEIADLTYHTMVLMSQMGITPDDIKKELESRHVVAKEESVK